MGYKQLSSFEYDASLTVGFQQGSIWDLKNGIILNLNNEGIIQTAIFGHERLSKTQIQKLYGNHPLFRTIWPQSNLSVNKNAHLIFMSKVEAFFIPFICHVIDLIRKQKVKKTFISFAFDFIEILFKQKEPKLHSFLTQLSQYPQDSLIKAQPYVCQVLSSIQRPLFLITNLHAEHMRTLLAQSKISESMFLTTISNAKKPLFQKTQTDFTQGKYGLEGGSASALNQILSKKLGKEKVKIGYFGDHYLQDIVASTQTDCWTPITKNFESNFFLQKSDQICTISGLQDLPNLIKQNQQFKIFSQRVVRSMGLEEEQSGENSDAGEEQENAQSDGEEQEESGQSDAQKEEVLGIDNPDDAKEIAQNIQQAKARDGFGVDENDDDEDIERKIQEQEDEESDSRLKGIDQEAEESELQEEEEEEEEVESNEGEIQDQEEDSSQIEREAPKKPNQALKQSLNKQILKTKRKKKGTGVQKYRVILWFRNDLRIHDNPVLNWASDKVKKGGDVEVVPVFCMGAKINPRVEGPLAARREGIMRKKFLIETVENLRKNLEALDSYLLVSLEPASVFIPTLVAPEDQNRQTIVVFQKEVVSHEVAEEKAVKNTVSATDQYSEFIPIWGSTLYHIRDLPFNPKQVVCEQYGQLLNYLKGVDVRAELPIPKKGTFKKMQGDLEDDVKYTFDQLPTVSDTEFQFTQEEIDFAKQDNPRARFQFRGGEDQAFQVMQKYLEEPDGVQKYKYRPKSHEDSQFSSRLSPWLANGSLSVRKLFHEARKVVQDSDNQNEGVKVFINQILWRDFFRFWFLNKGRSAFHEYGPFENDKIEWKSLDEEDTQQLGERWKYGCTGMPLIDAFMRELNATGYISNRGRQIVCSYLTQDLKLDWRWGAAWFEERLLDHDVHSNYGGWAFASGLGPSHQEGFNAVVQSHRWDSDGEFIRRWVPELKNVPKQFIHEPWNMPQAMQKQFDCLIEGNAFALGSYAAPINVSKYFGKIAKKNKKRAEVKLAKKTANTQNMTSVLDSIAVKNATAPVKTLYDADEPKRLTKAQIQLQKEKQEQEKADNALVDQLTKLDDEKEASNKPATNEKWTVSDDEDTSDPYKTKGSEYRKKRRLKRLAQEKKYHDETTEEESQKDSSGDEEAELAQIKADRLDNIKKERRQSKNKKKRETQKVSETEKLKRKIQQRSNKQTLKEHLEDKKAHPVKKKAKTRKRARSEGDATVKPPKATKIVSKKKKVAFKFKDETESSEGSDVKMPSAIAPASSILKVHQYGKQGANASDSADTHDSVSSIDDADVKSIMAACEVNHQKKEAQWQKQLDREQKLAAKGKKPGEEKIRKHRPKKKLVKNPDGTSYKPRKKKSGHRLAFGEHRGHRRGQDRGHLMDWAADKPKGKPLPRSKSADDGARDTSHFKQGRYSTGKDSAKSGGPGRQARGASTGAPSEGGFSRGRGSSRGGFDASRGGRGRRGGKSAVFTAPKGKKPREDSNRRDGDNSSRGRGRGGSGRGDRGRGSSRGSSFNGRGRGRGNDNSDRGRGSGSGRGSRGYGRKQRQNSQFSRKKTPSKSDKKQGKKRGFKNKGGKR